MRGRCSQLWGDNQRLGLAPWAKPSLRPNPVSQLFICVCLSTPITTRKVLILLLQEIKRNIIYRRAQLQEPCRREELHPRIQAHLTSVIKKISSLLEYQGTLQFTDGLYFLKRLSRIVLQA
jgi:hypothetical protein